VPKLIERFIQDESGAAMVEYGLLVALIALVVAGAATTLGTDLANMFTALGAQVAALVPAA
jgi:pilus assembly protein Flp/PilA